MHKITTNGGIMMIVVEIVFLSFIVVVLVIRTTLGHLRVVLNTVVIVSRHHNFFLFVLNQIQRLFALFIQFSVWKFFALNTITFRLKFYHKSFIHQFGSTGMNHTQLEAATFIKIYIVPCILTPLVFTAFFFRL